MLRHPFLRMVVFPGLRAHIKYSSVDIRRYSDAQGLQARSSLHKSFSWWKILYQTLEIDSSSIHTRVMSIKPTSDLRSTIRVLRTQFVTQGIPFVPMEAKSTLVNIKPPGNIRNSLLHHQWIATCLPLGQSANSLTSGV